MAAGRHPPHGSVGPAGTGTKRVTLARDYEPTAAAPQPQPSPPPESSRGAAPCSSLPLPPPRPGPPRLPPQTGRLARTRPISDRSSDVLGYERNPLESFFSPSSVAVIGATEKEGSVGRTVFWNLISSPFGGTVYPVNQKRASILGVRAYPNLAALPEAPGARRHRDARRDDPRHHRGVRGRGRQVRGHHLRRVQGGRSRRGGAGAPDPRDGTRQPDADRRDRTASA